MTSSGLWTVREGREGSHTTGVWVPTPTMMGTLVILGPVPSSQLRAPGSREGRGGTGGLPLTLAGSGVCTAIPGIPASKQPAGPGLVGLALHKGGQVGVLGPVD